MSRKEKGWYREPIKHGLASKGISTTVKGKLKHETVTDYAEKMADKIKKDIQSAQSTTDDLYEKKEETDDFEIEEEYNYRKGLLMGLKESEKRVRGMEETYIKQKVERVSRSRDQQKKKYYSDSRFKKEWLKVKYFEGYLRGVKVGKYAFKKLWDDLL